MIKKKPGGGDGGLGIDLGTGKVNLGGLFEGIEKLVDLAAKIKDAHGEIKKEGEINLSHLKEGMKGVYGFSIKTAMGGKPIVEPFGNIKRSSDGPRVEEVREPITDVFEEKEEVRVYAEMPGVNGEDIRVELKDDILDISAQSGDRKYHKEVLLKTELKGATLNHGYKNGILEIRIKK